MRLLGIVVFALFVSLLPLFTLPAPARAQDCQFELGFLTLQQMIPSEVGNCRSNVQYNPVNGDALQPTDGSNGQGGLLVWRKFDNFTAFTDGFRTWVNGPFGLQTRLNSERLFWESNPENLPVIPIPAAGERCHTAALSLTVQNVEAASGTFVATLLFNNNSNIPCTFLGFPAAQLRDAQNNALPTNVVQTPGISTDLSAPGLVSVPANAHATFRIRWTNVPTGAESSCSAATQLAITPPGEFAPVRVETPITACAGGRLDVSPIEPTTDTSRNWSGYVATGGVFTAVTGTWTIPSPRSSDILTIGASWVGIGGFVTRDLIQAGTDEIVSPSGEVEFNAWMERLPDLPEDVPLTVRAGDSVTVSIVHLGGDQWSITMINNTTGQQFQRTVPYSSSLSSAEWVEEAPSSRRRILPLADFGTVHFDGGSVVKDDETLTIAEAGSQALVMLDGSGNVIAVPSSLTLDGDGFSVVRVR